MIRAARGGLFERMAGMEIERKYRIQYLPEGYLEWPKKVIEQGYLCDNPVVRIRKSNEDYILTYKSRGGSADSPGDTRICQEVEVPLTKESYEHLREKTDAHLIHKTRYIRPLEMGLKAELDIFEGRLAGLVFAEVEFTHEEQAESFVPPGWFGENISSDHRYSNSYLAKLDDLADF